MPPPPPPPPPPGPRFEGRPTCAPVARGWGSSPACAPIAWAGAVHRLQVELRGEVSTSGLPCPNFRQVPPHHHPHRLLTDCPCLDLSSERKEFSSLSKFLDRTAVGAAFELREKICQPWKTAAQTAAVSAGWLSTLRHGDPLFECKFPAVPTC